MRSIKMNTPRSCFWSAPFMDDIVVSRDGVTKLLKSLKAFKALGPDELHPRVLNGLATER